MLCSLDGPASRAQWVQIGSPYSNPNALGKFLAIFGTPFPEILLLLDRVKSSLISRIVVDYSKNVVNEKNLPKQLKAFCVKNRSENLDKI